LVIGLRPQHVVVRSWRVKDGVTKANSNQKPKQEQNRAINLLDVAFVRNLLKENATKSLMDTLQITDSDLRTILLYVSDNTDLACLDKCCVLRLGNGKLARIQQSRNKIYYVVDAEGYDLFKDVVAANLIRPSFLNLDTPRHLALPILNVEQISATAIDLFVEKKLKSKLIETYSSKDSEWIERVSAYVFSKGFNVKFYETLPTLPVSNPNTFVSLQAWDRLPILPPIPNYDGYERFGEIAHLLPDLYVLRDVKYPPLLKKIQDCLFADRFLRCLYLMVKGNCSDLEPLFLKKMTKSQLSVSTS
jgi:hypothetical protein